MAGVRRDLSLGCGTRLTGFAATKCGTFWGLPSGARGTCLTRTDESARLRIYVEPQQ